MQLLLSNNTYLKSSLAIVVLYFFICSSEKKNSCTAILNDREIYVFGCCLYYCQKKKCLSVHQLSAPSSYSNGSITSRSKVCVHSILLKVNKQFKFKKLLNYLKYKKTSFDHSFTKSKNKWNIIRFAGFPMWQLSPRATLQTSFFLSLLEKKSSSQDC